MARHLEAVTEQVKSAVGLLQIKEYRLKTDFVIRVETPFLKAIVLISRLLLGLFSNIVRSRF